MTRYMMMRDRIYDLQDGSLVTDRPTGRYQGHWIWSAEALLNDLESLTEMHFIKPFYFLDVIE